MVKPVLRYVLHYSPFFSSFFFLWGGGWGGVVVLLLVFVGVFLWGGGVMKAEDKRFNIYFRC